MRRAAGLIALGALLGPALTRCLVGFDDYPVRDLDAGDDASGSGGAQAGAAGWASFGGGGSGGSAASAGTAAGGGAGGVSGAGAGGVSGAGAGGVGGTGSVDCSQYVHGMSGGSCYAYAAVTVATVTECESAAGLGAALVTCALECVNGANNCLPNEPIGSVTVSGVCILNGTTTICQPQCLNNATYDVALDAECDGTGKCVTSTSTCGNYRCDSVTTTCKTECKDGADCVVGLTCSNGVCL